MKVITVHLQSPSRYERIDSVTSFVGIDASGSFGILAGHERMMTVLESGIMRLRLVGGGYEFLAVAEGLLYFVDNELFISTRKFLKDEDHESLAERFNRMLSGEREEARAMRETIRQMEEELLKHLLRHPEVHGR